jgi:hypothetical protein
MINRLPGREFDVTPFFLSTMEKNQINASLLLILFRPGQEEALQMPSDKVQSGRSGVERVPGCADLGVTRRMAKKSRCASSIA